MPALTKEQLQDLHYIQDLNLYEIADLLGFGRTTVYGYRLKYGLIPKNQARVPAVRPVRNKNPIYSG